MAESRFNLQEEEEEEGANWLDSYSDLVTDLMAIFVVLFSFAMMSAAQQSALLKDEREELAEMMSEQQQIQQELSEAQQRAEDDLDMVYKAIKERVEEGDYSSGIELERGLGYILFRFNDSVLFYPDSPQMRTESFDILDYIADLLLTVQHSIATVEISGHTAKVSELNNANIVAWDLSSARAIAVLKFFVDDCGLPESKMAVAGYAHYRPAASNDTEEGRAQNRRVEVKITREGI